MADAEYVSTFAEPAISDIFESEYLENKVPALSYRFSNVIRSTCEAIISAPRAYPVVAFGRGTTAPAPDLRKRPLQAPFDRYLLFYRVDEERKRIEIVRVIHGARNFSALFGR